MRAAQEKSSDMKKDQHNEGLIDKTKRVAESVELRTDEIRLDVGRNNDVSRKSKEEVLETLNAT